MNDITSLKQLNRQGMTLHEKKYAFEGKTLNVLF